MKHLSGAPLKGRLLALPTNNKLGLKRLARSKHSCLSQNFAACGRKIFCNIGPCSKAEAELIQVILEKKVEHSAVYTCQRVLQ